jgi:hypothetical protein
MQPCAEREKLKAAAAEAVRDIITFADRLLKVISSEESYGLVI